MKWLLKNTMEMVQRGIIDSWLCASAHLHTTPSSKVLHEGEGLYKYHSCAFLAEISE